MRTTIRRHLAAGTAHVFSLALLATTLLAYLHPAAVAGQTSTDWTFTGITQKVTRFAVSGGVVYALAPVEEERPAALWRGEDGGTNWRAVVLPAVRIVDLAVHPTDPAVVYVGGSGGVYRSTDRGLTWTNVLTSTGGQSLLRIAISPADPSVLYAAMGVGSAGSVWRSLDGGANWERLRDLQGTLCTWVFPVLAPDPVVRERIYLSYYCAAGRNSFGTLRVSDDLWSGDGRVILQPNIRAGDTLRYVYPRAVWFTVDGREGIVEAIRDGRIGGSVLLRTQDGGGTWQPLLEYPQRLSARVGYNLPEPQVILAGLVVDGAGRIFVGLDHDGRGVLGSDDGGATWQQVGTLPHGPGPESQWISPVQALAYDPAADALYAGGRGLWRLTEPHPNQPARPGPGAGPWSIEVTTVLGGGPGGRRDGLEPLEIPPDADPLALDLEVPNALALEPDGSLLVVDFNFLLTRLASDGTVQRVPVTTSPGVTSFREVVGLAAGADGWIVYTAGTVQAITPWGETVNLAGRRIGPAESSDPTSAADARLVQPVGVLVDDASGAVYVADSGNHVVRRVDTDGTIHTVAGTGRAGWSGDGRPATQTDLDEPWGLAFDRTGRLLITDRAGQRVLRVEPNGTLRTVAGSGLQGYSGDGGPATEARFAFPSAMAVDDQGRIYLADELNHAVRVVDVGGRIWTLAEMGGQSTFERPISLAWNATGLYVADFAAGLVRRIGLLGEPTPEEAIPVEPTTDTVPVTVIPVTRAPAPFPNVSTPLTATPGAARSPTVGATSPATPTPTRGLTPSPPVLSPTPA